MATKAGAMDYIIKSELGIKRVPRSLHSVVNVDKAHKFIRNRRYEILCESGIGRNW